MSLTTFIVDALERPRRRRRRAADPEQALLRAVAAQRSGRESSPLASLGLVPHLVIAARQGVGVRPLTLEETADLLGIDRELVRAIEQDSGRH